MIAGIRLFPKFGTKVFIVSFLLALSHGGSAAASEEVWAKLKQPGHFAFLRHAYAPGVLADLRMTDIRNCSQQRNLDDSGRNQARRIGEEFRKHGIKQVRLVSSQYCRCIETARLLALGPLQELTALNYLDIDEAEAVRAQTAKVLAYLKSAPAGQRVVLVSHISNIVAATGVQPASGEMVVVRFGADGKLAVAGRIPPPK